VIGFANTLWHAVTGTLPSETEVQGTPVDTGTPETDLSLRDPALHRVLSRALRPESQRLAASPSQPGRGLREIGQGLRVWAEHRGIDTDVLGAPLRTIWPG
jgi:hypothetical protein